ncbi:MAG: hypothetical protein Q9168_003915 [Polycauliona sp. 1 TL-2023]
MGLLYRDDAPNIKFRIAVYMLIIPILIFYGVDPEQLVKRISVNVNAARSSTLSSPKVKALLKIALDTQSKTMPFVLLAAGIMFLLGLLSVLLLQFETKKAQRKSNAARKITVLKRLMLCLVWTSTALAFAASFSTTQLSNISQRTGARSDGVVAQSLIIEPGTGVQVLQWLAASFSLFFSAGVSSVFMVNGDHQGTSWKGTSTLRSGDIDDF